MIELSKTFTFEASHILPKHPGKCSRLHGHSWKLTVAVKGIVNKETGFVMDYADLKKVIQPIVDSLDHRHLGSWKVPLFSKALLITDTCFVPNLDLDFYPSSENLIVWIADQIGDKLDYGVILKARSLGITTLSSGEGRFFYKWSRIELDETCTSKAILTREDYESIVRTRRENVSEKEHTQLSQENEKEQILAKGVQSRKEEKESERESIHNTRGCKEAYD